MAKQKPKKESFRVILQLPMQIQKQLKDVAKTLGLSSSQYIRMKIMNDLKS